MVVILLAGGDIDLNERRCRVVGGERQTTERAASGDLTRERLVVALSVDRHASGRVAEILLEFIDAPVV